MMVRYLVVVLLATAALAQNFGQVTNGRNSIIHGCSGGSCPTTTTTTLPGCSPVGSFGCGTCGGSDGACLFHNPEGLCVCADIDSMGQGSTCDPPSGCVFDGNCPSGKFCFDGRSLGGPNGICCPLCASGTAATPCPPSTTTTTLPCDAPVYCRCVNDAFIECSKCVGGTRDGEFCDCTSGCTCSGTPPCDCPGGTCTQQDSVCQPTGRLCRSMDTLYPLGFCYHLTCSGSLPCSDPVADPGVCDAFCANAGGRVGEWCQNATCVGGPRNGEECNTGNGANQCGDMSNTCSGPGLCNCASPCSLTTSTTTSTTSTTTTTTA